MKVVYIIGPYRHETEWGIEQNICAARRVAIDIWRAGAIAICPHLNCARLGGIVDDEVFLSGGEHMARRADACVLCPHWEHSVGALREIESAQGERKPIFLDTVDFKSWYHCKGEEEKMTIEQRAAEELNAILETL